MVHGFHSYVRLLEGNTKSSWWIPIIQHIRVYTYIYIYIYTYIYTYIYMYKVYIYTYTYVPLVSHCISIYWLEGHLYKLSLILSPWSPPREMPVATGKAPVSVGMARLMTCENAMGTPWIPKVMACHGHEIMRKKTGEHEILFKKPGKGWENIKTGKTNSSNCIKWDSILMMGILWGLDMRLDMEKKQMRYPIWTPERRVHFWGVNPWLPLDFRWNQPLDKFWIWPTRLAVQPTIS